MKNLLKSEVIAKRDLKPEVSESARLKKTQTTGFYLSLGTIEALHTLKALGRNRKVKAP